MHGNEDSFLARISDNIIVSPFRDQLSSSPRWKIPTFNPPPFPRTGGCNEPPSRYANLQFLMSHRETVGHRSLERNTHRAVRDPLKTPKGHCFQRAREHVRAYRPAFTCIIFIRYVLDVLCYVSILNSYTFEWLPFLRWCRGILRWWWLMMFLGASFHPLDEMLGVV